MKKNIFVFMQATLAKDINETAHVLGIESNIELAKEIGMLPRALRKIRTVKEPAGCHDLAQICNWLGKSPLSYFKKAERRET